MTQDQKSSDVLPALPEPRRPYQDVPMYADDEVREIVALALTAQKAAPAGFVNAKDLESVKGNYRHMISMSCVAEPYYGVDVPLYLATTNTPPSEIEQAEAPSESWGARNLRDMQASADNLRAAGQPELAESLEKGIANIKNGSHAVRATLPPASKAEPVAQGWVGCGDCDVVFPCHDGKVGCFRNLPQQPEALNATQKANMLATLRADMNGETEG